MRLMERSNLYIHGAIKRSSLFSKPYPYADSLCGYWVPSSSEYYRYINRPLTVPVRSIDMLIVGVLSY